MIDHLTATNLPLDLKYHIKVHHRNDYTLIPLEKMDPLLSFLLERNCKGAHSITSSFVKTDWAKGYQLIQKPQYISWLAICDVIYGKKNYVLKERQCWTQGHPLLWQL